MRRNVLSPPKVLLLIRNRVVNDWKALCEEFGLEVDQYHTEHMILRDYLDNLQSAGLVYFEGGGDKYRQEGIPGKIEVSPVWEKIQTALGISLAQIADFEPSEEMIVRPYFGLPAAPTTKSDVFVLMPFAEDLTPVYTDHISKVVKDLELAVARADDFFTADSIMADIWNAICDTRVVIADCTGRNPNVFYEVGLAHTVGKRVVLITQNKDDIPFDIRHLRFIDYEYTPRGMKDFEKRLAETLKIELGIWD